VIFTSFNNRIFIKSFNQTYCLWPSVKSKVLLFSPIYIINVLIIINKFLPRSDTDYSRMVAWLKFALIKLPYKQLPLKLWMLTIWKLMRNCWGSQVELRRGLNGVGAMQRDLSVVDILTHQLQANSFDNSRNGNDNCQPQDEPANPPTVSKGTKSWAPRTLWKIRYLLFELSFPN